MLILWWVVTVCTSEWSKLRNTRNSLWCKKWSVIQCWFSLGNDARRAVQRAIDGKTFVWLLLCRLLATTLTSLLLNLEMHFHYIIIQDMQSSGQLMEKHLYGLLLCRFLASTLTSLLLNIEMHFHYIIIQDVQSSGQLMEKHLYGLLLCRLLASTLTSLLLNIEMHFQYIIIQDMQSSGQFDCWPQHTRSVAATNCGVARCSCRRHWRPVLC